MGLGLRRASHVVLSIVVSLAGCGFIGEGPLPGSTVTATVQSTLAVRADAEVEAVLRCLTESSHTGTTLDALIAAVDEQQRHRDDDPTRTTLQVCEATAQR